MLKRNFVFFQVQNNCQGQGYTLATRDDGQPICYFYMDKDYIRKNKPDNDDELDYEESKQMCADKGIAKPDYLVNVSCIAINFLMNKSYIEQK